MIKVDIRPLPGKTQHDILTEYQEVVGMSLNVRNDRSRHIARHV